ncbi:plasmid mobilization protein [Sphingobium algorifonticola]|nr:ribbon-helix-helix protein, CopG family [Sphingobium algorifonticola]
MKTDRLTLLISPSDKAAINARADVLGISVSELVRRAALDYDPDEAAARAELDVLLPQVTAAVARMHATFDRIEVNSARHREEMAYLRSDEYREKLQKDVWADPRIDWDWIDALRAGALHAKPQPAYGKADARKTDARQADLA